MKNMSFILIITLLIGGIGYLAFRSFSTPSFKGTPQKTVVVLKKVIPIKNGFTNEYEFMCGEKISEVSKSARLTQVIGDKYEALYDSLNCDNIKILYEIPLFLKHEETRESMAKIIEIGRAGVLFQYKVEGRVFERMQYQEKGFRDKHPHIEEGAKFPIKHWIKNPQRSIMYFEKE